MERILVIDTVSKIGERVKVAGWVETKRDHGKLTFIDLRDRSGKLQCVGFEKMGELSVESVVEITGTVKKRPERMVNPLLETGKVELDVEEYKVLQKAWELPFDLHAAELNLELPTLLDFRSLTLRHEKIRAIFKIQETIVRAHREVLKNEGFTEIFAPTIVPTATEGGAEVFRIDYYDKNAYLAQSPQFYKQIMVSIFERVFTLAHAYRAEPSVTTRHMSEYISLDAEMGFIDSWIQIMDMVEKVIKSILTKVAEENKSELKLLGVEVPMIANKILRLKMREAQGILFERTGRDHRNEPDLDPADEREICEYAKEKTGSPFVFITHYPTKKRPFYTMPDPEDPEYTLSFDLIGVNEEWVTGGQRINDYQMLLDHIKEWGNKHENFAMYLQAFKYGMPPEGGFAIGLERLTKDILGIANVREASLFPRDMERVDERLSVLYPKPSEKKS